MSSAPEIIVTDGPLLSDEALEALARLLVEHPDQPEHQPGHAEARAVAESMPSL